MEPLNVINKNACSATLLSISVSAYPDDCSCFCHLLKTQNYCPCLNGKYNPPLPATFFHYLSLLLAHPLTHPIHDTTVALKQLAQNSVVLASYVPEIYILQLRSNFTLTCEQFTYTLKTYTHSYRATHGVCSLPTSN